MIKGSHHSEASKKKISLNFNGGHPKGIPFTPEHIKAMSFARIGKNAGDKNPMWRGDKVGYRALHNWIEKILGKASKCINGHIAPIYHWANISGEYKRDISDWHELCPSCNNLDGVMVHSRFQ